MIENAEKAEGVGAAPGGQGAGFPFPAPLLLIMPAGKEGAALAQLLAEDYPVLSCDDPAEAIHYCNSKLPGLVMVQEFGSGGACFELVTRLRAVLPEGVPVVLLLEECVPPLQERALDAGATDVLCLAWSTRLLLARIALLYPAEGPVAVRPAQDALEREWWRCCRSALPLSLIMLAVRGDLAGHQQEVEALLQGTLARPGDQLDRVGVGRYRCILPETAYHGALSKAESFSAALEGRFGKELQLVQGVVSCVPERGAAPGHMRLTAEEALVQAALQGVSVVGQLC